MAETPAPGRDVNGPDHQGTAVTNAAITAWFIREILPLEANLMRYLQHNWRNASDLPDLRQEIYARVLEAAHEKLPDNPRNFLFVCARNHLINLVRREQVVPMETFADLDALGVASGAPQADRLVMEQEELRRVEAALEKLPARTREAVALAYFEGLSRTEIAKRMGVSHQAASRFIAKGTLALGDILFGPSAGGDLKS
jgi:RNA polymerase sigma-70 factor (ECF subfamily)